MNISCLEEKEAPYPYLTEVNPLRQQIGLRIIDSTFIYYGYNSKSTFDKVNKVYYDSWQKLKNKYRKPKTEPAFWEKFIRLNENSGKAQYEEDRYRSGYYKYGFMEETDIFETLRYKYVFEDYKFYSFHTKDSSLVSKGWEYIYEYPSKMTGVASNRQNSTYWEKKMMKVEEIEADSILHSWGLRRVNY